MHNDAALVSLAAPFHAPPLWNCTSDADLPLQALALLPAKQSVA